MSKTINNQETKTVSDLIYSMLTESTGAALCDSGGAYGRHWERNQKRSKQDFENDPGIEFELYDNDITWTISIYHLLSSKFELDGICNDFNSLPCENWNGESMHGISAEMDEYLSVLGQQGRLEWHGEEWNTYNGDSNLSQTLQGRNLTIDGNEYVLLQIHNGCDVRGGYTDAKLFRFLDYEEPFIDPIGNVYVEIDGVEYSNGYNGYSLTTENGEDIPENKVKKIYKALVNAYL